MPTDPLVTALKQLSQGSKQSVQTGSSLDAYNRYMNIPRPIETIIRKEMNHLRNVGGGVLLLVGNAGDGKSHIAATLKSDYPEFLFHNDASESLSPTLSALDTLKAHLKEMSDESLPKTTQKIVVNINLGKLSELIDDADVVTNFNTLVRCARTLFDKDEYHHNQEERIRIVFFGYYQIFEIFPDADTTYPVDSLFVRGILKKITIESSENPFYNAYKETLAQCGNEYNPVVTNYQLLCMPDIQNSIVMLVIEAIVRYKMTVTPRELLDFIYRILVPTDLSKFAQNRDFFAALLPTRLFVGVENRILKTIAKLDPVKYGCTHHNKRMSVFFTSEKIPDDEAFQKLVGNLNNRFFELLDGFFKNNRSNVDEISALLLRTEHLLDYHSESEEYIEFLGLLCASYANDIDKLSSLYELVKYCIPRYYGTHIEQSDVVPLSIQGKKYKFFANCECLEPTNPDHMDFDVAMRNQFLVRIETLWTMRDRELPFRVDFPLYERLRNIQRGRLTLHTERDQDLVFGRFLTDITELANCDKKIMVITPEGKQHVLYLGVGNKLGFK